MGLHEIREELSILISEDKRWPDKLNETSPGHYGILEWDARVLPTQIWLDIQACEFTFKNADFDFTIQLNESGADADHRDYSKKANGSGTFNMENNIIKLNELKIDVDLDLHK